MAKVRKVKMSRQRKKIRKIGRIQINKSNYIHMGRVRGKKLSNVEEEE